MLSQVARSINESATLKLNALAGQLRARGEPVIHLGGGEPTSKAPPAALQKCAELLNTGEVRYTPPDGIIPLKKALIDYTQQFYGRTVAPENVMASGGAKQAIMVCLQAILDPGDEVIFPAPYWVSYPDMVRLAAGVPIPVPPPAGTFHLTLADIERRVTPRTRAVILNSPSNPAGILYSEAFVADVVQFCERRELYLILDDIYHRLIFDGRPPVNGYAYTSKDVDGSKLVIANSVSKMYAMTGFRLGWAVGARALIRAMGNIQGHQTSGPSALSQWAAIGALTGDQSSVAVLRETLERNRDLIVEKLQSIPNVRTIKPDGTFYSFPDFSAFERDSVKLAGFLLDKVRVVTVPGVEFGMDGHLRISFCSTPKDIGEGLERIRWALDPRGGPELRVGERLFVRDW